MKENSTVKKVLDIAGRVFVWFMVALAVFMMIFTILSATTVNKQDKSIFGIKAFIVLSDSMAATDFDAGDLIFSVGCKPEKLEAGDIITFQSQNSDSYGEVITHKIRKLTTTEDGLPGFITYGTTTDSDDESIVPYAFVMGKYIGKVPNLGHFMNFLKTTPGYIICILLPFLALIIFQGINCIKLFRRYKSEQLEEMNAERAKIEAERAEAQKMMQELLALKQQLAGQGTPPAETSAPTDNNNSEN